MGEADPYRLKRRAELRTLVNRIIRNGLSRSEAGEVIELAWSELDGIHEGNYARYRIQPSEFEMWQRRWK